MDIVERVRIIESQIEALMGSNTALKSEIVRRDERIQHLSSQMDLYRAQHHEVLQKLNHLLEKVNFS